MKIGVVPIWYSGHGWSPLTRSAVICSIAGRQSRGRSLDLVSTRGFCGIFRAGCPTSRPCARRNSAAAAHVRIDRAEICSKGRRGSRRRIWGRRRFDINWPWQSMRKPHMKLPSEMSRLDYLLQLQRYRVISRYHTCQISHHCYPR